MRIFLHSLCFFFLLISHAAWAAPAFDFTTTEGTETACAQVLRPSPSPAQSPAEQQAEVICRDLQLVRHVATFASKELDVMWRQHASDREFGIAIRRELLHMRGEMRATRALLEKIRLRDKTDGLMLEPSQWIFDLDGNGRIDSWESHLFAIPRRERAPSKVGMPADDDNYYRSAYQLDARFLVDQSDVQWALGYHYFAEALVELVLAYQLKGEALTTSSIVLTDPAAMRRSYALLLAGFKSTDKLRRMVLAETDDDHEWIPNPRQQDSVFPVPLDDEDFKVWSAALELIIPLLEGKTLLAPQHLQGGILGGMANLCPNGQGLSIPAVFRHPPRQILRFLDPGVARSMCQKIDAAHPQSQLLEVLGRYANRAGRDNEMGMIWLRQLLWGN